MDSFNVWLVFYYLKYSSILNRYILASISGKIDLVKTLLKHGANKTIKTKDGQTAEEKGRFIYLKNLKFWYSNNRMGLNECSKLLVDY